MKDDASDGPVGGSTDLHGQSQEDLGSGSQTNPPYAPMTDASDSAEVPEALDARPDRTVVIKAAKAGHSRLDAERYALLVAQVITDTRDERRGSDVIDDVVSARMDQDVRKFLVQDVAGQRAIGTGRYYDTRLEMWIRSSVVGPADHLERVNVEVVGNLSSEPMDLHSWQVQRFDVAWESGRWALVGYSGGRFGPDSRTNMTPAQRREFLTGPGWRRISP